MSTSGRAGRDQDWTDAEAEGQPITDDQPPGIGPDTAEEGTVLPSDHPLGAEAFGVTAAEEARGETLAERVAHERPDRPEAPPDDGPGGRLVQGAGDTDDPLEGEWDDDDSALSAEEAALHIEDGR